MVTVRPSYEVTLEYLYQKLKNAHKLLSYTKHSKRRDKVKQKIANIELSIEWYESFRNEGSYLNGNEHK